MATGRRCPRRRRNNDTRACNDICLTLGTNARPSARHTAHSRAPRQAGHLRSAERTFTCVQQRRRYPSVACSVVIDVDGGLRARARCASAAAAPGPLQGASRGGCLMPRGRTACLCCASAQQPRASSRQGGGGGARARQQHLLCRWAIVTAAQRGGGLRRRCTCGHRCACRPLRLLPQPPAALLFSLATKTTTRLTTNHDAGVATLAICRRSRQMAPPLAPGCLRAAALLHLPAVIAWLLLLKSTLQQRCA
jgi:hypothetical protein